MIANAPSKSPKDFAIEWRRSSDLDRRVLQVARIRLQPLVSYRPSVCSFSPTSYCASTCFLASPCCFISTYHWLTEPSCISSFRTCCDNWPRRSCKTPSQIYPLSHSCYREGECWKNDATKAGMQYYWGAIHLWGRKKPGELSAHRDIPLSSSLHHQLDPTSKVPNQWFLHLPWSRWLISTL